MVEKINPYHDDSRPKEEQVREMFDNIAPAYDFMNRAMTLGIDRSWRRKAVELLPKGGDTQILDIATGTGDLALLIQRITGSTHIVGIDLSDGMLQVGRRKVADAGLDNCIEFMQADSLDMPFSDNSFDAITVAYGVRNFADLEAGYREMLRVLRPGGKVVVLELSTPKGQLTRPLYNIYTRYIIPTLGRLISRDARAYTYLPESIAAVPQADAMTSLMEKAGFVDAHCRQLTFGACSIYSATKPT